MSVRILVLFSIMFSGSAIRVYSCTCGGLSIEKEVDRAFDIVIAKVTLERADDITCEYSFDGKTFGDKVKVKRSVDTERIEIADMIGEVYGETTPSVTGVDVIGHLNEDHAFNVHFDEIDKAYWFSEDLLEFIGHNAGTEITLAGVDKKWIRGETGEWVEVNTKPWWKFW